MPDLPPFAPQPSHQPTTATGVMGWLHRQYERPWVYNLNQVLLDGNKTRPIRRFLADVPYDSVVDIGCGTGNWAALSDGPYLGVDASPAFVDGCRRRYADDPNKRFVCADATTLAPETPFDLAQLISVLHHLPDDAVHRLTAWVARSARYFFVLDLYPIRYNPLSRFLYKHDRGDFIRTPEAQKKLILNQPDLRLIKASSFYAPTRLYRHTLFLFETPLARTSPPK